MLSHILSEYRFCELTFNASKFKGLFFTLNIRVYGEGVSQPSRSFQLQSPPGNELLLFWNVPSQGIQCNKTEDGKFYQLDCKFPFSRDVNGYYENGTLLTAVDAENGIRLKQSMIHFSATKKD